MLQPNRSFPVICAWMFLFFCGCDYFWSATINNNTTQRIELAASFEPPPVYLHTCTDSLYRGRLTHFWSVAPKDSLLLGSGITGVRGISREHLRLDYYYLEIRKPGDTIIYPTMAEIITHCDSIDKFHYRLEVK